MAHVIQFQAMLAIDRGVPAIFNAQILARLNAEKVSEVLNG